MNFSLKNRITFSFVIAIFMILVTGFYVFFFLDNLNGEIEDISIGLNNEDALTDEIQISVINIVKMQRKLDSKKANQSDIKSLDTLCEGLKFQIKKINQLYADVEIKQVLAQMLSYVDSYRSVLDQALTLGNNRNTLAISTLAGLSKDSVDKIVASFSDFVGKQYLLVKAKQKKMLGVISSTKRSMLIVLILTFLGAFLLSMVVPGKIALPFKKIGDAIRELQECNFDVSIYYKQKDEIGEIAHELNKMIVNIKKFEELRTDRIAVELRKFDALANMVKKNVIVADAEGKMIYFNNRLYSLLQIQSNDILGKVYKETLLPDSIKEAYDMALRRRSKIENAEVTFVAKELGEQGELVEKEYAGFANVIPIRGKKSHLDYYLMIISKEVFV